MTYCLVVPHFNHTEQFKCFLPRLVTTGLPIYVVDDGSQADELVQLRQLAAAHSNVRLEEMGQNQGKGAAVLMGFEIAAADGHSHAIQIDADGQHDLDDLPHFLRASKAEPGAIISGRPIFEESAPKIRVYGRRITNFFTALETMSLQIEDALCGFRVYPLAEIALVTQRHPIGLRMDFDTDILVKAVWHDIPIFFVDTRVIYIKGGASHFSYLRDNLRLIGLHSRLITGMLIRLPMLLWQRWTRGGARR